MTARVPGFLRHRPIAAPEAPADRPAQSEQPRVTGTPGLRLAIGLAAAVIIAIGCAQFAGIIGPTVLALVVTICVQPARVLLQRLGLGRTLASTVVVIVVLALLVAFGAALVVAIGQFATIFPQYSDQITAFQRDLADVLHSLGLGQAQVQSLLAHIDPTALVRTASGLVSDVFGLGFGLLLVVGLVVFMAIDAGYARLIGDGVRTVRPELVAALEQFSVSVRRYMLVTALLGAIVSTLDTVTLLILAIPGALLWGLLAFITGFIPNIGYWIGIAPPVVLAYLSQGWRAAVAVIVIYAVINGVIQSGLQPKIVGSAVSLNQTITFLSVIFWTVVLGGIGAVLAVPLTLLARAFFVDANPSLTWMRPALGDIAGLTSAERRRRRGVARSD